MGATFVWEKNWGQSLWTVIIFQQWYQNSKMLVNFSGIFIFGLLLRIVLALSSSYNPNILLEY